MKPKTDMTPGVVGTALAAVAAGSLVLFSLVLQQSAFDPGSTDGLKVLSPTDAGQKIIVQAAPEENDSAGETTGETTVAETFDSDDASAPGTESFSPIPDDDGLVAGTDFSSEGEFPNASGGTGNTVAGGGIGATATARGPQATISKDPNGRPDDVTLPDRNGPKNTAPPHGPNPDRRNDDSDGRADRDEPQNDGQRSWSKDRPKNDRQKSWAKGHAKRNDRQKSWAKTKQTKNDKSNRDKNKPRQDKPRNTGKSNNNDDGDRDRHSNNGRDRENRAEDRNDRHDSRKDSDEDDDRDDDRNDDDDDRHDDSHHSNDDSRGHSGSRGPKK